MHTGFHVLANKKTHQNLTARSSRFWRRKYDFHNYITCKWAICYGSRLSASRSESREIHVGGKKLIYNTHLTLVVHDEFSGYMISEHLTSKLRRRKVELQGK